MKALIVYAHSNPASFSSAIRQTAEKALVAAGHEVRTRDLYAQNFNPVLSGADFQSFQSGKVPADIAEEQEHVAWADTLIVIFPVWWTGLPAIAKGWIDRVFSYGFAYQMNAQGAPEGLLKGKKSILITPHGTPTQYYEPSGMLKSLTQTQDGGIFQFCSVEPLKHFYLDMGSVDQAGREGYLKDIENFIATL